MNTNLMQPEKSVLFLISLSQDKIQEIINKGVDYGLFLKSIRGNSHVEVQETINEKLLSSASHYRVVVIVGHQIDGCIEMADGSLFPMAQIVSSLPSTFSGYLHVAVCGSSIIFNATKEHCPDSRVRTSQKTTQLELQLLIYSLLLNRTDLSKETFDYWYEFERNYIKEIQERKNPADLAKLPCATKLGAEPSESIKTSVFAPEKVTRGEFYQLQIFMHLDEATGTLYFDDAKGNDPNAARKKVNVALKNIHKGDIISLYLSFLDAEHLCPTNLIIVHELDCEEDYYTMVIPINEEKQEVVLHVKVTREYPYSRFFTELKFIKDNECLTNPFNWETEVKTDDSQNSSNIERPHDISGGNQYKPVRPVEKFKAGRPPESMFKNSTDKEKWAKEFTEFLKYHKCQHDFKIEAKKQDYISMAFVSFYVRWIDMKNKDGKSIVEKSANGPACFRFLTEDCRTDDCCIGNDTPQKQYGNFIRGEIDNRRNNIKSVIKEIEKRTNEVDEEVSHWFFERGLNNENS